MARKESLAGLRSELQAVKSELVDLQQAHTAELTAQQEVATKQLAAHVKTADAVVKELEATALNLQEQLAAEVERADAYDKELKRLVQAHQHSVTSSKVCTDSVAMPSNVVTSKEGGRLQMSAACLQGDASS
jgi:YesN/AraC family two-component response regulator